MYFIYTYICVFNMGRRQTPAAPKFWLKSSKLMSGVLGVTWLPPSRFRSSRPPDPVIHKETLIEGR